MYMYVTSLSMCSLSLVSSTEVCDFFQDLKPSSELSCKISQFLRRSDQLFKISQPRVLSAAAVGEVLLVCHFFQIPLLLLSELKFCLVC